MVNDSRSSGVFAVKERPLRDDVETMIMAFKAATDGKPDITIRKALFLRMFYLAHEALELAEGKHPEWRLERRDVSFP